MSKAVALLATIEKQAAAAINETAYASSYDVGSTRWDQAKARAAKAEVRLEKAISDLRKLIAIG